MSDLVSGTLLLLVLLNPFLIVVYLTDLMAKLSGAAFASVLWRAGLIAWGVFSCFAVLGDAIFANLVKAEFASFQIFGGLIFIMIGLQFVFRGPEAIELLRGESDHVAGAIAMPVLIGPGTISASVVLGERAEPLAACAGVGVAVGLCIGTIILLKKLHDFVLPRSEALVARYIEVAGRITALFLGTIAVEMIMRGLKTWMTKF